MMDENKLYKLLSDWDIRITKAQIGHYMSAEKYIKWHYFIGGSLIILSSFVSSSLFLQSKEIVVNNILIISSISATILAGLQTLISPSEKAEIHRSKASKYGSLRRRVELFSSTGSLSENEAKIFIKELKHDWDNIAGDSPLTPRSIRSKVTKIMSKEMEDDSFLKKAKQEKKF